MHIHIDENKVLPILLDLPDKVQERAVQYSYELFNSYRNKLRGLVVTGNMSNSINIVSVLPDGLKHAGMVHTPVFRITVTDLSVEVILEDVSIASLSILNPHSLILFYIYIMHLFCNQFEGYIKVIGFTDATNIRNLCIELDIVEDAV